MNACKECPFIRGSTSSYDTEGLENLDAGHEPSCHKVVGCSNQFSNPMPTDKEVCRGYLNYLSNVEGFSRPRLLEVAG